MMSKAFVTALAIILICGISPSGAAAAPRVCGGAKFIPQMTIAMAVSKSGRREARSLVSIAAIIDSANNKIEGWLALDQRGTAWIQMSQSSTATGQKLLHARPVNSEQANFEYYGNATRLPNALSLESCEFIKP